MVVIDYVYCGGTGSGAGSGYNVVLFIFTVSVYLNVCNNSQNI